MRINGKDGVTILERIADRGRALQEGQRRQALVIQAAHWVASSHSPGALDLPNPAFPRTSYVSRNLAGACSGAYAEQVRRI
jgi:hypothetical protein